MHFRPKSQLEWINKPPLYLGGQSNADRVQPRHLLVSMLIRNHWYLSCSCYLGASSQMSMLIWGEAHVQVCMCRCTWCRWRLICCQQLPGKILKYFQPCFLLILDSGLLLLYPLSFLEFILYWYYDIIRYQPLQLHDNHVSIGFINIKCYVPSSDFHPPTRFQWCKRIWIATSSLVK